MLGPQGKWGGLGFWFPVPSCSGWVSGWAPAFAPLSLPSAFATLISSYLLDLSKEKEGRRLLSITILTLPSVVGGWNETPRVEGSQGVKTARPQNRSRSQEGRRGGLSHFPHLQISNQALLPPEVSLTP